MTTRESSALVDLATRCEVAAGVNYSIRYYPLNIEARSRILTGELGVINSIYGSYVQDWLLYPTDTTGLCSLRKAVLCVLSPTSAPIGSICFRLLPVWKSRPFVPI